MRALELGLSIKDMEDLTEGMISDLIEEKMMDNSENDTEIEVIRYGRIDDFFPI